MVAADSFDRGTGFEVTVTTPATSRPATTVDLAVSVKATHGRKLNEDYPFKIDVAATADVRVSRSKLDRSGATSFNASGAEFRIEVTSASAGKVLRLDVRFAMCTDVDCEPYRDDRGAVACGEPSRSISVCQPRRARGHDDKLQGDDEPGHEA